MTEPKNAQANREAFLRSNLYAAEAVEMMTDGEQAADALVFATLALALETWKSRELNQ